MAVFATMSVVMPTILRSAATRCYSLSASLGFSMCGFSPRSSPQQLRASCTTQLRHLCHNHYRRRSSDHSFGGLRRVAPQEARMSTFRTSATISSELKESVANNPGVCETPDEATKSYFIQQTMYRIKDPKVSLDFYTRILGMTLLKRLDFPEGKFSLYFLGYEDPASIPTDPAERLAYTFSSKATLELTHNWGTESDESFKGHHNGNSDPRGYGHIGITVDDTYKACERFEKLGVKFVKKPDGGSMKGLAFIQDPDGYWIEIFDVLGMKSLA